MNKLFILTILFTQLLIAHSYAIVDPPNYNFSLDSLAFFLPGSQFTEMEKKYGKAELMLDDNSGKLFKFYVAQIRYKFPVFVRIVDGKSVDFHARLPTYFSHDLFHQALINRYGKQDTYFKLENTAAYKWKNKKGVQHIYTGTCTITCFPIFYSATKFPIPNGHTTVTESMLLLDSNK